MKSRQMQETDLFEVVKIHQIAFPNFFMTQMGSGFLLLYYRFCLEYPYGLNWVCEDSEGVLVGFVVGFGKPSQFYAALSRSRRNAILPILLAFLHRPQLIPRFLHNLKRGSYLNLAWGDVELASIGVSRPRVGVGKILLNAFLELATLHRYGTVYLTTDAVENEATNSFYRENGFNLVENFLSQNRSMNVYNYQLAKAKE
jgi:GNAT superfamily N-acetyltransferase